jgi:hypothetical protein
MANEKNGLPNLPTIFRERLVLILEREIMQTMLTNIKLPALISFLLVLPLMVMELINRRNFNEGFPFPLFIIIWLLSVLFILAGMPIVRSARAGSNILANPILLLVRVVLMVFLAWFWVVLLIDQLPCFLGVPNCD